MRMVYPSQSIAASLFTTCNIYLLYLCFYIHYFSFPFALSFGYNVILVENQTCVANSDGSINFEKVGGRQFIAPSHFVENAHNELYAFYTGKGELLKKILRPIGGATAPTASPVESATGGQQLHRRLVPEMNVTRQSVIK